MGSFCKKICAGIVTFNPEISRLSENIDAIRNQVDAIFIVDNNSNNIDIIKKIISKDSGIKLICNNQNRGIATALNQLMKAAEDWKYSYVITLDQDSVSTPGMVSELVSHIDMKTGIVSPQIVDRNMVDISNWDSCRDNKVYEVHQAARKGIITSGALTSIEAWKHVGGFDDSFFIDYVDYDFNKRLLLEGYRLIRTGRTILIHECGNMQATPLVVLRRSQNNKWHFERFYSFGHSPFRCYYKARNRILFSKKYAGIAGPMQFEGAIQIIPQIILTLLFEKNRKEKFKSFIRGIIDGCKQHVDKYVVMNNECE